MENGRHGLGSGLTEPLLSPLGLREEREEGVTGTVISSNSRHEVSGAVGFRSFLFLFVPVRSCCRSRSSMAISPAF